MKRFLSKLPLFKKWVPRLNNLNERTDWVEKQLKNLSKKSSILDAGCGSQRFRKFCKHLNYKAQDFGEYKSDEKEVIGVGGGGLGNDSGYRYGPLDYVGDIWDIKERDDVFDAILCTEVFEHISYPVETVREFGRLLKPGGQLILTAPFASLRHMDPYFFYSGFSDRWFKKILEENGFKVDEISPVGDYYSWLGVEMARTALSHNFLAKVMLFPAFIFFFSKRKTNTSINTLCMGYHVLASKI